MNHLERVASIVGTLLVGIAAFLIVSERSANNRARNARHAPVEVLAEELKGAWAGYHHP